MAIIKYERSGALVSWIDPATGLPEVDHTPPTSNTTTRAFLTGKAGFRFCNFIDIWANFDTTNRTIVGHGFTSASGIYRAPSFAKIPSHVFPAARDVKVGSEPITFTQAIGCRTESPEVIGTGVGGVGGTLVGGVFGPMGSLAGYGAGRHVGGKVAREVTGFPPIWSQLRLKLFNDGRFEVELLQHSFFPSLTFYKVRLDGAGNQTNDYDKVNVTSGAGFYNAVPNLERWKANGWGAIRGGSGVGPTEGNPYNMHK